MNRIVLFALILCLLSSSCAPTYLVDKSEFSKIPKGSKKIVVSTSIPSDSLYALVSRSFIRDGWVIKGDKDNLQISAEPKSVGSGTALKPMVYIERSTAYYSGEWGLDQDGQLMLQSFSRGANTIAFSPIVFQRSGTTKNDVAFQGLLVLAKKIGGEITYSK